MPKSYLYEIYFIFSGLRRSCGTQGVRIIIQSDREPKYLDARIEKFMLSMREHIDKMSEEEFETNKQGLIEKRLEKPKKLSSRANKYWAEIISQQFNFERDELETNNLKTITKDDVLSFFDKIICPESNARQKMACYIIPSDTSEVKIETDLEMKIVPENVTDVVTYKQGLSLYPLPKLVKDPANMVRKI